MKECKQKYKLLIVLGNFGIGGAQNMVYELVRCINREFFEINILCCGEKKNNFLTEKVEKICNVKYLEITGTITFSVFIRVLHEITIFRPDIIHSHLGGTVFAVPWGLLHSKPVIVTAHTSPEKAFSKTILPILKYGIHREKVKLVAVSKENQQLLMDYFNIGEDKCAFVNNGIDVNKYYRKTHNVFTFINVGRQDNNKNQIAIVRSFSQLKKYNPDIILYLVGDGEKHEFLIKEVEKCGLSDCVKFPGTVGNTEDYYALADCYIQSSHREALPLTALEAMAAGLPLISTNVGGMSDIVTNTNGFLVADEDDNALYEAMKSIVIMTKENREKLGEGSKKLVQKFSAEKMAREYERIYMSKVK